VKTPLRRSGMARVLKDLTQCFYLQYRIAWRNLISSIYLDYFENIYEVLD